MNARGISPGVYWVGAVDWDRRLFDALIPLPDGTSYNAYLIQGSEKTALLDSVDPRMQDVLLDRLDGMPSIDYVVAHHAEPDHSGAIPAVLERYPAAKVLTNPRCKGMLMDTLLIPEDRFITVEDGETVSLGDKTLKFVYMPWVHWPETMVSYLQEDRILFTCDFFGSHIATTDLYVTDEPRVYEAAKRYYAEIMMPFRKVIEKNLAKLADYDIAMIAPSHGPIYNQPAFILDAYREWVTADPKNIVVLPYISMWGSTKAMVDHLVDALIERGVAVELFNLAVTDVGKLAMALVDAATIVVGTPTVLTGAHPGVVYAAYLANALRPKLRFASIVGSYGWGGKAVEQIASMIPNLKVEVLAPVLCQGYPREADFEALDCLADAIAERHRENHLT
ncbi:MAG: FprA family A-type flavoprotein [Chloroflexi bacterium]|nr:FprA family A-type flavoprotein [Chloroflexota bacterium]MBU1751613.1 FprA family A-type flavoprotein [Chloroflexota bacterium]